MKITEMGIIKNIKTKYGEIEVNIPRDRKSTFEPQLVKKRQRLLEGTEDLIVSLYRRGLSIKDIQHYLDDLYGYGDINRNNLKYNRRNIKKS